MNGIVLKTTHEIEDIWAFGSKTISLLPIKVDINFETRVELRMIGGKLLSSHSKTLKH